MPNFTYKARDEAGKTIKGTLIAENEEELAQALDRMKLYLVSAFPIKADKLQISRVKVKRKELISFTVHLAITVSAGISLLQGLQDLMEETEQSGFKKVVEDIRGNIIAGSSLSESLERHPRVFSELYVSIVRAGEVTGNMEVVLSDLVKFLEWQEELASSVKQATIYPAFILGAVSLLIVLLMAFVFPRFAVIFENTNVPLPTPTRIVMSISHIFTRYWWCLILGIAGTIGGYRVLANIPAGRLIFDRFKLNFPVFGELLRKIAISRFAYYLGTLYKAGIGISQSLLVVERVVGNAAIAKAISVARDQVVSGESMSKALGNSNEFPSLVIRMIKVGESTGNMDGTLAKVSQYYDREIPATIKKVFAIFEPMIVAFLAFVVLGMALSMFLPLYQIMGLVGK